MTGQVRDEEDNQLYRRLQMMRQARDEEDNQLYLATSDDGTSQG